MDRELESSPRQQRLRRRRGAVQGVHPQTGDAAGAHAGRQPAAPLPVAQRQALRPGAVEGRGVGVSGQRLGKQSAIVPNLGGRQADK